MKTVKLTFNYDFPVMRQTQDSKGRWGDYQFIIDPDLKACDYWVVYTAHDMVAEQCYCDKNNIFFIPGEGYETSARFSSDFLKQFGKIITVQRQLKGNNITYFQNANPWFIEKSYNDLLNLNIPEKTKLISIISSDKDFTEGHRNRQRFTKRLKEHFGEGLDFFGRGINSFDNKWDVTAPYKYQIAIENDFTDDWVTEKFFDPILTYTYPFYYGCPNLKKYMPDSSFQRIDINDPEGSIRIIENAIRNNVFDRYIEKANACRDLALNHHQLFPMLVSFFEQNKNTPAPSNITIRPSGNEKEHLFGRLKRKIFKA